ncbi:nucleotidyltransferase domain-containing protein [Bacillus litorisediminis]|uniref:nucleotidyltransferase domain-containing protein n=1 Tax=Bacillus litorisediminis TaxID=2922713 RepID=UPI001FAB9322|nr:nucleotidyltransferase domain-containing protein [Bacillus litorisediminis]
MKLSPELAALKFIAEYFSDCDGALLSGSVVRGEETSTSDLDIVIFQKDLPNAYRETFYAFDWPIEVFVHNFASYNQFFESDRNRARASLARMIAEGKIIREHDFIQKVKKEAEGLLEAGPKPWSEETIQSKRYMVTDVLDDFIGAENPKEELWIANALANLIHEFILRTNQQWLGSSKWVYRALLAFNPMFAEKFYEAFHTYYRTGEKKLIIALTDEVLAPFGGRLAEGYSAGK